MRIWLVLFLTLLIGASLGIGVADLSGGGTDAGLLLAISRWPRTAAALLAGAGLALAGVVVQLTVQNRLVEPGLTGTPEAAMIGLLGITIVAPGASILLKMGAAAMAALAGTLGFLALARHVPRRDPVLLPLVGLVYGGILGAAALWGAWVTDLLQYLGAWTAGEFSGVLRGSTSGEPRSWPAVKVGPSPRSRITRTSASSSARSKAASSSAIISRLRGFRYRGRFIVMTAMRPSFWVS